MIYLIKPDNIEDIYPKYMIDDFVQMTYGFRNMHSCEINDTTCYLYGFTNKKEYYKIFKKLHDDNLFIYIKKDINKEDYYSLREYDYAEILEYEDDMTHERLIVTKREADEISDLASVECTSELYEAVTMPYDWYKKEYIIALDKLLYCNYYCSFNDDKEDEVLYSLSYGVTIEGYGKNINPMYLVIPIYLKMYKLLLRK